MQITRGKIIGAQKIVVYGPEGIGKSTFASKFPNPVFIDTEGSTKHLDVARLPAPSSWTMLLEQIRYIKSNPDVCGTLVIDTADWAEQLCTTEVCAKAQKSGIEDFGYGKGYIYLAEEFGRMLNSLSDVVEKGINVVITAHARMRKFEQPDEMGAYDRWELKLQKSTAPLVKEWADMVLFANYKTFVVNVDNQGAQKGKNKAQGGARVIFTSHHPCWDAKNRHGLGDEIPFDFASIAHCITSRTPTEAASPVAAEPPSAAPSSEPDNTSVTNLPSVASESDIPDPAPLADPPAADTSPFALDPNIPKPLYDLMTENDVSEIEVQVAVASKGYYPDNTPIKNYAPDFISGVLVAAWPQVYQMIKDIRELPFVG